MDTFGALADPTRRGIIELLCRGERAAGEITDEFAMSAPAVSQHLRVLREAGLVRSRAEGQRRIYSLHPSGWGEVERWLARVRRFWPERLDDLERELRNPHTTTSDRGEGNE